MSRKMKKHVSLAQAYPKLAREWHPKKNGELRPKDFRPFSNKKAWWQCKKGHEWEASITNRAKGRGCPYCSGHKVGADNNLAVLYPAIARQWHPERNLGLSPRKVRPHCNMKVWWKCKKGHEWKAVISNRVLGRGCPYCAGKKVGKDNNLAVLFPAVARQWHPDRNGKLSPRKVRPHSNKNVWWKCEKGHEWQDTISHRVNSRGCPYCSGRRAGADNNLAVLFPELVRQWHPTRNHGKSPYNVRPGSIQKIWWICDKGHEWMASIDNRVKGRGCSICSGKKAGAENNLAVLFPEITKQWHPTLNGEKTPFNIRPGSGKEIWWVCDQGHEWQAPVYKRTDGQGCPYCIGRKAGPDNNLAVLNPKLALEWHPTRNGRKTPSQFRPGSGQKVWWKCPNGHSWRASILSRTKGSGCPQCYRIKKKIIGVKAFLPKPRS